MRIPDVVEWIDHRIDAVAEQVSERGGTDHRNEQIGPGPDAVMAKRVAERAAVVRQARGAGHIDHAPQPRRRIDHEPDRRLRGAFRAKLQQVIDHHRRLGEVDHDVVDRLADRPGGELLVDEAQRPDDIAIQRLLDSESLSVELLERIAGRMGQGRRGGQNRDGRRHAGGEVPRTHRSLRWAGLRASAGGGAGYDRLSLSCILCIGARNQWKLAARAAGWSAA
jgi:hypothetical protein